MLHGPYIGNTAHFMEQFEMYAEKNSFEISLLLALSCERGLPSNVKHTWLQTFHSLSKSIKIHSFKHILNDSELITKLFNSCTEYKACSHFIENNLIPLIIDYEVTNDDLIAEIIHLYQARIQSHATTAKASIFRTLGWIELFLFLFLNLSDLSSFLYFDSHPIFHASVAFMLLIATCMHLYLAVKTFNKRRIFCYYLQSLSPRINKISHQYTPFILEGFNLYNLSLFHNADYNESLKLISPDQMNSFSLILVSFKYIILIIYALSNFHTYLGLIAVFISPILVGTLCNLDGIYRNLYESSYQDIIGLYTYTGTICSKDESEHEYQGIASEDVYDDEAITETSTAIDAIRNKDGKMKYCCRFSGYVLGYSLIMLCVWPILLLTPFIFGFSIMCCIDPGLEYKWPMRQFSRYWAAFMAIKVILGMTLVIICDLCWGTMSRSSVANDNEEEIENTNEVQCNYDAYNTMCFSAMNMISIAVVVVLVFGMNSWQTIVFRAITWGFVYVWITAASIKRIIPTNQRVMNWKATFKINKWLNSNLLETEL